MHASSLAALTFPAPVGMSTKVSLPLRLALMASRWCGRNDAFPNTARLSSSRRSLQEKGAAGLSAHCAATELAPCNGTTLLGRERATIIDWPGPPPPAAAAADGNDDDCCCCCCSGGRVADHIMFEEEGW